MQVNSPLPPLPTEIWLPIISLVNQPTKTRLVSKYFSSLTDELARNIQQTILNSTLVRDQPSVRRLFFLERDTTTISKLKRALRFLNNQSYSFKGIKKLDLHKPPNVNCLDWYCEHYQSLLSQMCALVKAKKAWDKSTCYQALRESQDQLDLSEINLVYIPSEISLLSNLTSLDLSANKIKTLPAQLGLLSNLEFLDISANRIIFLPSSFGHLQNLKTLLATNNRLSRLPENLSDLIHLHTLDLSENRFTTIPEWLNQLPSLRTLLLCDNRLQRVDIGWVHGGNLDLRGNPGVQFPYHLQTITGLKVLV